jgi:RimJ/RimL family protein N-acetyltransferase
MSDEVGPRRGVRGGAGGKQRGVPWPEVEAIESTRVRLEPLTVAHADEMLHVLAEPALYEFTGGRPPTLEELRLRYTTQAVRHSPDQRQWWLNWIVVLHDSGRAAGYVQATVEQQDHGLEANIAWVIGSGFQRRGLATEAATAMIDWLTTVNVDHYIAYINPAHAASAAVARKLGMRPTAVVKDGEVRWQSPR